MTITTNTPEARIKLYGYDPDAAGLGGKAPGSTLSVSYLSSAINSIRDTIVRAQVTALQTQAIKSGHVYSQLERDLINRLTEAVDGAGQFNPGLAANLIDTAKQIANHNPNRELNENQRQVAFLIIDASGNSKCGSKDLQKVIDKFRELSLDWDGFTEVDAKVIKQMLAHATQSSCPPPSTVNTSLPPPSGSTIPSTGTTTPSPPSTGAMPPPPPATGPTLAPPAAGTPSAPGAAGPVAGTPPASSGGVAGRVSVSAQGALLRTPPDPYKSTTDDNTSIAEAAKHPVENDTRDVATLAAVGKVYYLGLPGKGFIPIKFVSDGKGKYNMMQGVPEPNFVPVAGQKPVVTKWVAIETGISGTATAQMARTYEFTAGVTGNVGYSTATKGDPLAGSGVAAFGQYKWLTTVRVQEQNFDKRGGASQFRVRFITEGIAAGGIRESQGGVTGTVPVQGDAKLEYRWGRTTRTRPSAGESTPLLSGTPGGSTAVPNRDRQYEVGLSVSASLALDPTKFVQTHGDEKKLEAVAATLPAGSVTAQVWLTELQGIRARAIEYRDKTYGGTGPHSAKKKPNLIERLASGAFTTLGNTFQNWVGSAYVTASLTGNKPAGGASGSSSGPVAITRSHVVRLDASNGAGTADAGALPSDGQLSQGAGHATEQFTQLIDYLKNSGLASVLSAAQPIIQTVMALNEVRKLASKKGILNFTKDSLTPGQNERLEEKIMQKAFDLVVAASVPGADGKIDPKKSMLKLDGESVAQYGARITKMMLAKIPEAAKDVLLDSASWDDFLLGPSVSSSPAPATEPASEPVEGEGAAAADPAAPAAAGPAATAADTAAGSTAAAAAAAGAGLGLGGALIGGIGSGTSDGIAGGKDDPDNAAGNAGTKAMHTADAKQGNHLSDAEENTVGPTLTNVESGDPRFMAAFVARLAANKGDVGEARSYAQQASRLGISEPAAVRFAGILTPKEVVDPRFMAALAGRLGFTGGDLLLSLGFARDAVTRGFTRDASIYFSATVTRAEAADPKFMNLLEQNSQTLTAPSALQATRQRLHQMEIEGQLNGGGAAPTTPPAPVVAPTPPAPAPDPDFVLAGKIISAGAKGNGGITADELANGVKGAGLQEFFDDDQAKIVVAAFDGDHNGALGPYELTNAIKAGAVVVQDGQVGINVRAATTTVANAQASPTTGTFPGQGNDNFAANIAGNVIAKGSHDDAYANRGELVDGFSGCGFELKKGSDLDAVIAAYSGGKAWLSAPQLAAALSDGAITLNEDGSTNIDPGKARPFVNLPTGGITTGGGADGAVGSGQVITGTPVAASAPQPQPVYNGPRGLAGADGQGAGF